MCCQFFSVHYNQQNFYQYYSLVWPDPVQSLRCALLNAHRRDWTVSDQTRPDQIGLKTSKHVQTEMDHNRLSFLATHTKEIRPDRTGLKNQVRFDLVPINVCRVKIKGVV